jgi:hypothetical protein
VGLEQGLKNRSNLPKFAKIRRIRWWLIFQKMALFTQKLVLFIYNSVKNQNWPGPIFSTQRIFKHWAQGGDQAPGVSGAEQR